MDLPRLTPTVAELLSARRDDDHTGLRFEERSWTWRQVVAESQARAVMLHDLRTDGPFHVGVLLENVPEFLFLLGGAALAGAVVVGINPTRRGPELARDIRHTDCQLIITDETQGALINGLDTGVSPDRVLVSDRDGYADALSTDGWHGPLPGPETLYLLLFTSGSTGSPKAVKVSQGRLATAASFMAVGAQFGPEDVLYCAMPMFHGNALNACVVPAMAAGSTLVLRRRFSATGFLPDVRNFGVTFFNYVGRALGYILATAPSPQDTDNRLRFALGTDASPHDISAFKRRFGCPVVEGYGSSEGAISLSRVPGTPRNSLGKPPPGMDVAVVNRATGEECPPARFDEGGKILNSSEAIGEIVSRDGATRFEGYYANAEADAERTKQGWFWSGDLGYRDEDGFYYFAGRPADWLRVDGENFAAAPVERILSRFDGVVTAAVYPVPDPRTGDQVMVALELAGDTTFDPDAFATFLGEQPDLGTKWAPMFVRIVAQVPVTGTNKVDKRPLAAQRWETSDAVWWRPPPSSSTAPTPPYRRLSASDVEDLRKAFEQFGRASLLEM